MYTHTHTYTHSNRIPLWSPWRCVFVCIDRIIVVCSHLVVVVHHSVNERACARALPLRALRHTVISPLPPPAFVCRRSYDASRFVTCLRFSKPWVFVCVCARLIRALYLANWLARYPLGLAEKNNNSNSKKKTVMPCCVAPITKTSYIADAAAVSLSLLSPPSLSLLSSTSTSFASLSLSHLSIVCLCMWLCVCVVSSGSLLVSWCRLLLLLLLRALRQTCSMI